MFGLFLLLLLLLVAKKKKKVLFFYFYDDSILARAFFWLIFIHFYFQCLHHGLNGGVGVALLFFSTLFFAYFAQFVCVCVYCLLLVVAAAAAAAISALFLFKCISPTCWILCVCRRPHSSLVSFSTFYVPVCRMDPTPSSSPPFE